MDKEYQLFLTYEARQSITESMFNITEDTFINILFKVNNNYVFNNLISSEDVSMICADILLENLKIAILDSLICSNISTGVQLFF